MQELKWNLAQNGFSVKDVTHVLVTHYHMDHGAIAQELKDKGAKLIVLDTQRKHLNDQKKFIKPPKVFHEIKNEDNVELSFKDSRSFVKSLGMDGEIVPTIGHCEDHVSLVLDEGIAFTGDLPPENSSPEGSEASNDWKLLRSMNVKKVYPAHGNYNLPI